MMEFARFRKNPSDRLFEQFYVIGIDEDSLDTIVSDFEDNFDNFVRAKQIYKYPHEASMKQVEIRSKIIQDWVFPEGVKFQKVDSLNNSEVLRALLFEIPKNRKNTFIFTLDANVDQDFSDEVGVDNFFNVLCLKYNKVSRRESDGETFLVEQAFCMISNNNYF
jgi:hypothetical protein